jgi:hypothetical protein
MLHLWVLLESILCGVSSWVGIACISGAWRFAYRPLVLAGIAGLLLSAESALDALRIRGGGVMQFLAFICIAVFILKYYPGWRKQGIGLGQLLFLSRH